MRSDRSQMHMIHGRDASGKLRNWLWTSIISVESPVSSFLFSHGKELSHPEIDGFLQRYEPAFIPIFLDSLLAQFRHRGILQESVSRL